MDNGSQRDIKVLTANLINLQKEINNIFATITALHDKLDHAERQLKKHKKEEKLLIEIIKQKKPYLNL